MDLRYKLSSRSQDEGDGEGLSSSVASGVGHLSWRRRWTVGVEGRENGEQETARLSGTGLSTTHDVSALSYDGDRVLLDGRGNSVLGKLDVFEQVSINGWRGEFDDWLWNISASDFDWDVTVLVKVDTSVRLGVHLTEELLLNPRVVGTNDMLAILPGTFTGASRPSSAATTGASTSRLVGGIPSTATASSTGEAASSAAVAECAIGLKCWLSSRTVAAMGRWSWIEGWGSTG